MTMKLKVFTGLLNPGNKGSCDWGWQGLLAHGCQTFVVVIDPKSVQVLQVLSGHKAIVGKIRWAQENYHHDGGSPYSLRLASADSSGCLIVWDVTQGYAKAEFSDGNKAVSDFQWVSGQDTCRDLLVALHHPYVVILWNADTGTKLWKKAYTDCLTSLTFDPFDPSKIAFLGQECIVFIDDFSVNKIPSSNGKKFYISSPSTQGVPSSQSSGSLSEKKGSMNLARRVGQILIGDVKPGTKEEDEGVSVNECLQLSYHLACRHHLILLYGREVLILDLDINQTVGIIPMERSGSPFVQVVPCRQRDVLMCLHENGAVSLRVRRQADVITTPASEGIGAFDDSPPPPSLDVSYDLRCQTDTMRVTKHSKVLAMACCPMSERSIALVMSDSRVIFWDVRTVNIPTADTSTDASPDYNLARTLATKDSPQSELPLASRVPYPKTMLSDMIGPMQGDCDLLTNHGRHTCVLKFLLTGLLNGISGQIMVIRMCPPLTTKNWNQYKPLLAVGLQTGVVQILDLSTCQLDREYSIHTSPVRGIEWVNLHSFLSFSYPTPVPNSSVKNDLVIVDIPSGRVRPLRTNKESEPPIEFIRVSNLKQYFMIVIKDRPCELWDVQRLVLLREMTRNMSHITAFEWAPPSYSLKNLKKRHIKPDSGASDSASVTSVIDTTSEDKGQQKSLNKEHFIFTDHDGTVYHMVVEGSVVCDSSKIASEPGMSTITSIIWKSDYIIYGDTDGHFNLWDLRTKKSKYLQTNRGVVKKIRFGPGRGNHRFLALYTGGLDVWDGDTMQYLERVRHHRDLPRIVDTEWAGSEQPVIATDDGCVRVMDMKLSHLVSPVDAHLLIEDVFCPHLTSTTASLTIKYLLQHQPFYEGYEMRLRNVPETEAELLDTVNRQLAAVPKNVGEYLVNCRYGTAERCLITARLMGDEGDVHFWTVALHYLMAQQFNLTPKSPAMERSEEECNLFIPPSGARDTGDPVIVPPEGVASGSSQLQLALDRQYDVIIDKRSFLKHQLDRVALHDSKRATYEHTSKCAERYMMLGQTDRAVQLLLETEPDNEHYYVDSLRACLVASIRSSGASQSTIKLVATNLIANGKLSEGVQLLCLIDKTMDACRYLQTYGKWHQAAWLAKAMLSYSECSEVMKRWADHLYSAPVNQKSKSLLVMLSLGQYTKVIEMLYTMRHFDRAACFIEACLQFGVLQKTISNSPLLDAVYIEYAHYMTTLGNRQAAVYYCHLAGPRGEQYEKEVEIMFGETLVSEAGETADSETGHMAAETT